MDALPYPDFVCGLQLPLHLRFVAALAGAPAPDPAGRFAYADLGCGQGRTAAAVAALHPAAEVIGLDLSPDHVAAAERFRDAAGLGNLRYAAADLATLDPAALPPLDVVAMHGLWAWVPPAVRDSVLRLLAARLRPGGLCYVSYNALPGAVTLGALRAAIADLMPGGSPLAEGLAGALRQIGAVAEGGGVFFAQHPVAARVLRELEGADLRYVAHEYLAACWDPQSAAQMGRAMARAGLEPLGSAVHGQRLREGALPEPLATLVAAEPDPWRRAALRDLCLAPRFRADVFRRPGGPAPAAPPLAALRVALTRPREAVPARIAAEGIELDTSAPPLALLLDLLAEGPRSVAALAERLGWEGLDEALLALATVEAVRPVPADGPPAPADRVVAHPFNAAAIAAAAPDPQRPIPLVAPAIGGILATPPLEAALIEAHGLAPGDAGAFVAALARRGLGLAPGQAASRAIEGFRAATLPRLAALGVMVGAT